MRRRHRRVLLGIHTLATLQRRAAIPLAALLAVLSLVISGPPAARAQGVPEAAVVTVDPPCSPLPTAEISQPVTLTFHGHGFTPGGSVTLFWAGSPMPAPGNAVLADAYGSFAATVTVDQGQGTTSNDVAAYYSQDLETGSPLLIAQTAYASPCNASITLTPDCADAGTDIDLHIAGTGFSPDPGTASGISMQARVVDLFSTDTVYAQLPSTPVSDPNAVSLDMNLHVPPTGAYRVIVDEDVAGEVFDRTTLTAIAYFVVPCSQLFPSPPCGAASAPPTRHAIMLSAAGLQPGLQVNVVFDPTGEAENYYTGVPANSDGSWGPVEIDPFARGSPAQYDIEITQSNDTPPLHYTHATFTVECSQPQVTLGPNCASPQFLGDQPQTVAIGVHGTSFPAGSAVTFTFDPEMQSGPDYTPDTGQTTADGNGAFDVQFPVRARPSGTYHLVAQAQVAGIPPVQVDFTFPCGPASPSMSAKPSCAVAAAGQPGAYKIRLTGKRFLPGFVQIVFDPEGTPQSFSAMANTQNGRFDSTITVDGRGTGTYHIVAQQQDARQTLSSVTLDFNVPCSTAGTLTITPTEVGPGFVVVVEGTGFPPNKTVDLFWSQGIGADRPIEVTTDADGAFTRQVLIFAHDFAGTREMTAGTPADPAAFPDAQATLLVSPGQGSPPGFTIFGGASNENPFVLRR